MKIGGELFAQQFIPKLMDGTKTRTSRPVKPQPTHPYWCGIGHGWDDGHGYELKPKYQPGDVMYCREAFCKTDWGYAYMADCPAGSEGDRCRKDFGYKWRPSIHMPREAARIFLRVTDVKVQRIEDVTERDAVEDGFTAYSLIEGSDYRVSALDQFKQFWLSQYGPDARWMWVYYFERISKEEAEGEK